MQRRGDRGQKESRVTVSFFTRPPGLQDGWGEPFGRCPKQQPNARARSGISWWRVARVAAGRKFGRSLAKASGLPHGRTDEEYYLLFCQFAKCKLRSLDRSWGLQLSMPQKIFISYRREDAGANALGISQYLEKEFGRKSVFIDVDMRAGAKFPAVLEERLAECKVMLVLIGPEWLNSRNEHGQRRIDLPDDWVRLEIAQALKRDITVIPVRVNGAMLPSRETLPEDIRGLLDHQAVSLTLAGFRHEMSGLVRDIRAIPSPRPWRRFGVIAAGVVFLLAALAALQAAKLLDLGESFRSIMPRSQPAKTDSENGIWISSPGEWVLYGADKNVAYYFKPSEVGKRGDYAVITTRFPFKPPEPNNTGPLGAYQEDRIIFDCKKLLFAIPERTIYNKAGVSIFHFKRDETESLNSGESVPSGTPLFNAARIACDDSIATSLAEQIKNTELTYLSGTEKGDGDLFYGPAKRLSQLPYQYEVLLVAKLFQDHSFAELFAIKPLFLAAQSYRSSAQLQQLNCTDRKVKAVKIESFDSQGNLVFLNQEAADAKPLDVKEGTSLSFLLNIVCGAPPNNVAGTYEGIITMIYKKGGKGEQNISISIEQTANDLKVAYQTPAGAQGKGAGTLESGKADSISLQSTTPGCAGSYQASFRFADDSVTFSFKGEDCGGTMEGNGTAKKVKA
jgi:hypothetical protein